MRKITQDSINAFLNRQMFTRQNMKVRKNHRFETYYLMLHNNIIAILYEDDTLIITNCGWFTRTTRERLNGLPNVNIIQRNFEWFLNGNKWNGEKTVINYKNLNHV